MNDPARHFTLNFLAAGGEMGALTRAKDWSATPLGPPETWPQSLRTTVGLLLTSNHPMFIWWGPELIQFYNDAYAKTMGPERHPGALGQRGRDCWAEIWPIIGPQIEQVMAGGAATWHEEELVPVTRHGRLEEVWWTYGYSPINDEHGGVGGVLVVCNDVTEQHRTTAALRTSEERLQFALDAGGGVGIWDWDLVNDRVYADTRLAQLYAIDPTRAAEGAPVAEYTRAIHADDRDRIAARIKEAVRNAGEFAEEYRLIGADGATRWIFARGRCYHDESGSPLRFPGVGVDITERKQAMEALQDADRRKDEFLAMLGHELRNPLAPILSAVDILERSDGASPADVERAREIIGRQSHQLRDLVDDLLDVARITTGKITLKKEPIDIASAVDRAVEQTRDLIESNRHDFQISLPDAPVYVRGDLSRLTQVISNLLNNAAKYTEPGGAIRLEVTADEAEVTVKVSDTGMGIAADVLPHVFELFTQSRRGLDRALGGLGIGLTLVRRLVELHGGTVAAQSNGPGQGSEFRVSLPAFSMSAAESVRPVDAASGTELPARRILVVDDNVDGADMLSTVLGYDGHRVATVHNGLEVVDKARAFRPDIILLDLGLPGMSGYEIARALRSSADLRDVTLVALTGYGQEEDRQQTQAHGFDYHLVKPVDFAALNAIIAQARGRSAVTSGAASRPR
jgi:signal transduction histidine kinase/ActR/RegA family two-component response regulator